MSRASQSDHSSAVSLFPFLAVLLCTMGALVVLLVAMSHVSRSQRELAEAKPADDPAAAERIERMAQINAYQQRADQQQAGLSGKLKDDQQRLRHLEDHIRRMHDQLQSLKIALAELQQIDEEHFDDRAQAERELQRLRELIEQTKQEIEQLEAERDKQAKSYSIVPYKGRSGTLRRPVYIECRKDRVTLQPEGVELGPDDFTPPLGVGNPLAAVLRSAKEYYGRLDGGDGYNPEIEPYPLLIVRPDGIADYYRVREAIRAWDSDFGYELVNADWELAYPTPNPDLAAAEQQALDSARSRREMLARAMPRAYGGGGHGAGGSGFASSGGRGEPQPYDQDVMGGPAGAGFGAPLAGDEGPGAFGEQTAAEGSPAGMAGGGFAAAGVAGAQGPARDPSTQTGEPGAPGEQGPERGDAATGSKDPANASPDKLAQQPSAAQAGQPQPSQQQPGGSPPTGAVASAAGATGGPGGKPSSESGEPSQGGASASFDMNQRNNTNGLTKTGVSGPDVVSIRRPVRLFVEADRVSIVPEEGRARAFADAKNDSETFANAIRKEIDSWGAAGRGLTWRPVVTISASPEGAARAGGLARMLRQMGLDVNYADAAPATAGNVSPEGSRGTR
ncbi:hypothetical protein Pla175_11320 [Pirellulimonas nuda]|uniref:IncA protein n=1 Tax=Pirellulimonas nuda TaxID=2528009 RepID=A0A518D8F8_9BACT|nr:hypothetical protein [Pirellulimonas nuda]QDU87766.1 hypothetical protein Pla175_11320 [Pirellulimonas nuda]